MKSRLDFSIYLRSILIASILVIDTLIATNRSMPPASQLFSWSIFILLSSWWIWKIHHRTRLPRTPISLPMIAFMGAAIISTVFSIDPRRSLDGLLATLAVVLIFFLICDSLLSGWKTETFELTLLIFVGFLLILGIWKICDWYLSWVRIAVPDHPLFLLRYRLYGITGHPNFFAMLIYISLPFAIFRLARARDRLSRITWLFWLFLADIVFLFVDSRGGLIASVFVLVISIGWLLLEKGKPIKGKLSEWFWINRTILVTTLVFIGIFLALTIATKSISPNTAATQHGGGVTAGRLIFWKVALEMFQNQPLTGSGAVIYSRFYLQENPAGISGWFAPHAHNLYLDIPGQYGVLGFAALVWMLLAVPIYYLRNRSRLNLDFQASTQRSKDLAICALAGLTGFLIQSFVDVTIGTPHSILPLIIVLALGLYAANLIQKCEKIKSRLIPAIVLILLAPTVAILLFRQNKAHSIQMASVQSSLEDRWTEAASNIDQAIQLDPGQTFYEQQRGFAYGALAMHAKGEGAEEALHKALESYSTVVEIHPFWAPNYVNYAALLERSGESERALATLEAIPPKWLQVWSLPELMLADRYAAMGDHQRASELFTMELNQNPWVRDMAICRASKLCQQAAMSTTKDEVYVLHEEALAYLENGDPAGALKALGQIPDVATPPVIWIDRAAANLQQGKLRQSWYELSVARKLMTRPNEETFSYFFWTVYDVLSHQGKIEEAFAFLEYATKTNIKAMNYEYFVFQRTGFPDPLLPSVSILEKNKYDLLIFEELADYYQDQGRLEEATWARNQAQILAGYLEGVPPSSTSH